MNAFKLFGAITAATLFMNIGLLTASADTLFANETETPALISTVQPHVQSITFDSGFLHRQGETTTLRVYGANLSESVRIRGGWEDKNSLGTALKAADIIAGQTEAVMPVTLPKESDGLAHVYQMFWSGNAGQTWTESSSIRAIAADGGYVLGLSTKTVPPEGGDVLVIADLEGLGELIALQFVLTNQSGDPLQTEVVDLPSNEKQTYSAKATMHIPALEKDEAVYLNVQWRYANSLESSWNDNPLEAQRITSTDYAPAPVSDVDPNTQAENSTGEESSANSTNSSTNSSIGDSPVGDLDTVDHTSGTDNSPKEQTMDSSEPLQENSENTAEPSAADSNSVTGSDGAQPQTDNDSTSESSEPEETEPVSSNPATGNRFPSMEMAAFAVSAAAILPLLKKQMQR